MLDENGKFNNLAFLLSDENTHIVKFAVYRNDKYDFAVKKEFEGSWIACLIQALQYTHTFNDVSASVIGSDLARTEIQSYPDPSLREAVVNAFAHFDPSFPSDIKIEFFPDKVVIGSPGSLYHTTMKEVLEGRQSFRNPNLVHVLNKFNFIENYATGIKKIIEAYEKYDEKPIFNPTDNFFIVTLPNVNKRDNGGLNDGISGGINELGRENAGIIDTVNDTVNDTVKQLILRMKEKPNVTIAELSNELHKSRITIIRTINKLKEQGYLARVGSDKTGYWKVLK